MNSKTGSPARVRGRDLMGDGMLDACTGTSGSHARARVREDFYGPTIVRDTDAAVDYALETARGDGRFRRAWCFYCLRLGVNTFLDQLDSVLACARQGEIREPARAFHARLRKLTTQLFGQLHPTGGAR